MPKGVGNPYNISSLIKFSQDYLGFKNNWHHEFFYLCLENLVYQDKKDGKFYKNWRLDRSVPGIKPEGKKPKKPINNRFILVLSPRFHSKSTVFSFVYPLWEIVNNPNIRILIVSANEYIARGFVRQIQTQLEINDKIKEDFGQLQPRKAKKWGEKAFIVERDTIEKDPTVSAAGLMGKIVSKRADIIILDDIIDLESARTEKLRNKVLEWYEKVLYPILTENGRMIVVGTKWFKGDIYDVIETNKPFDIKIKLKALLYDSAYTNSFLNPRKERLALDADKVFSVGVKRALPGYRKSVHTGVLWPDKWSYEKLQEIRRDISDSSFYSQYMNEPVSNFESFFKKDKVDIAYKKGNNISLPNSWDNIHYPPHFPHVQLVVAMGVDLAASQDKRADNNAIAIWGLAHNGTRYLLYLEEFKGTFDEVKEKIITLYYLFNPIKVVVESNVFQQLLAEQLGQEIDVEGIKTTSVTKFDEQSGLYHMQMLFDREKVVIPAAMLLTSSNKEAKARQGFVQKFYEDLTTYVMGDHTPDMIMASWFAFRALREYDALMKETAGFFSPEGLVFQNRKTINPSQVFITPAGTLKYSYNSFLYFYGKDYQELKQKKFFTVISYFENRALAFFFDAEEGDLVAKIDAGITPTFLADYLLKNAKHFNEPVYAVIKQGAGQTVLSRLQFGGYSNLYVMQPTEDGLEKYQIGIDYTPFLIGYSLDYLKFNADKKENIIIKDKQTIKEIAKIVGVQGLEVITVNNKFPERAITFAIGAYLLHNFNVDKKEKKEVGTRGLKEKIYREYPPYSIFKYKE